MLWLACTLLLKDQQDLVLVFGQLLLPAPREAYRLKLGLGWPAACLL